MFSLQFIPDLRYVYDEIWIANANFKALILVLAGM